tara:strand:- start:1105 stop:1698 length:594 start_codon:yes stop_codon:yes gene_type:complete
MKKFDWKPKKGSFRTIQEGYIKRQVLKEEASSEQIAMSKKFRFNADPEEIDIAWIKKNNMEKVWSRKSPAPEIMKIAKAYSDKIKKAGGIPTAGSSNITPEDMKKVAKIENEMKSLYRGWEGRGGMYYWTNKGGTARWEPKYDDFVDVQDIAAQKEIHIDNKTGKINIKGGGMGGFPFPAANPEINDEGGGFGYQEM